VASPQCAQLIGKPGVIVRATHRQSDRSAMLIKQGIAVVIGRDIGQDRHFSAADRTIRRREWCTE
jgi:hypothetical protein